MAVDVGAEAIDRGDDTASGYTFICRDNPASKSGTIVKIEIWALNNITGLKVGSFYKTNSVTWKCRAFVSIAGTITAGAKVEKVVSLAIVTDDLIGCYYATGDIERDGSGYAGIWRFTGDACNVDDEETYASLAGDAISLGGYFEVVAVGRSFGLIIG